ncbi:MAG: SDR family oxidoreductase [Myxococcota bacterium]|nr:SDR family oxidoreductase [Myxococcota bacterium]
MSVLILGATSPIAYQVAHRYAELGHSIVLTARDNAEASSLAQDISIRHDVPAVGAAFDACDFASHAAFVEAIEIDYGPIEVALVAFGEMGEQAQSQKHFPSAKAVIDINYTGAASICEAIASKMEARTRGVIIGITSVAGDRGRQSNYIYGSAKGAFTLYLQGLRNRLCKHNVQVMTVRLGFVDTRMTFGMKTGIPIAPPNGISHAIVKHQESGSDDVYLPRFWQGIMLIIRNIPERVFKRLSL